MAKSERLKLSEQIEWSSCTKKMSISVVQINDCIHGLSTMDVPTDKPNLCRIIRARLDEIEENAKELRQLVKDYDAST